MFAYTQDFPRRQETRLRFAAVIHCCRQKIHGGLNAPRPDVAFPFS
jgi:hypothetical protein